MNSSVSPRVHITLAVQDERVGLNPTRPVGGEELTDIGIVCALQLECEANTELKVAIEKLYGDFKVALAKRLSSTDDPVGR